MRLSTRGAMRAAALLLAAACSDDAGTATTTTPVTTSTVVTTTTQPTTSTTSLPGIQDIREAGALEVHTSGNADWVTVAGDSAWLADIGVGITRHDLATGAVLGEIATNDICLAMDAGFGSLWAGDCVENALLRIDVATGELVATIDLPFALPSESSVAAGVDGVWVLTGGAQPDLVRIDPTTNEVADIFPGPSGANAVRAGFGSLWITRSGAGQLVRVDPATGESVADIDVAPGSTFLAVGEGGVWTMGSNGEVVRVDPVTSAVVATIPTGGRVDHGDIAVGGGYVWARITESLLVQIDPVTDTVVARFGPSSEGSGGIAADSQAVWVSDYLGQTLWRLPIIARAQSGLFWPQSNLDEVRLAQELADAGDREYTWQRGGDGFYQPGQGHPHDLEFFGRFLREVLGWEDFRWAHNHPSPRFDGFFKAQIPSGKGDVVFVRCEAGLPRSAGCVSTLDGLRYETVRVNVAQLIRPEDPYGIFVVTRWEMLEPYERDR